MAFDIRQHITDTIIAKLAAGTVPWQGGAGGGLRSFRACGTPYRGINTLVLYIARDDCGYGSETFMTYRQAAALGGQVRKGEKGHRVVKYGTYDKPVEGSDTPEKRGYLKGYTVFNAEQIDGLPGRFAPTPPRDLGTQPIALCERFFNPIPATIRHGNQVCYIPSQDEVRMPYISQFHDACQYYGTLAHELVHWTHAPARCDRKQSATHRAYALEELVAELGAAFTMAHVGVSTDIDQSASYIGSWLKALRNDNKFIFKAAGDAQRAADYLISASENTTAHAA